MSNVSEKNRSRSSGAKFFGIPLWMSLAVLCGGLLVGSLISLASGKLGLPFVLCFIIGVVFSVLLTEPRSLFLSVVSIPIFFSIAAGTTGWFLNQQISRPNGSGGISKTQILSAIYPLLQQFPVMAIATIGAGIIAYLRWHLVTRYVQQSEKKAAEDRRRDTETQKRAIKQANRVRTAAHNTAEPADEPEQTSGPAHPPSTGSITVAELIKRNQRAAQKGQRRRVEPPKPATPASAKPAPAQAAARSPEDDPATPEKPRRTPATPRGQQPRTPRQTTNATGQATTSRHNPRQTSSRQVPPQRQTQQPQRSATPQPQRQNPPQRQAARRATPQQRPVRPATTARGGQQPPQSDARQSRPGNNLTARQGNPRQQQRSQAASQSGSGQHSSGQQPRQQQSRMQRNQQATPQASRQQSSRQQPSSRSTHASNRPAGTPRSSAASGTHSAASQASQASTGRRAARQAGHQANRQSTQQPQKRTQRTQRTGQPAQRRAATPNQPASRRAATTSNGSRSSRQDRQNPRQDHHDPQKSTGSTPPKPRVRRRRALNDDLYS